MNRLTSHAKSHIARTTFGDSLLSHFGSVNWPPTFCDVTPLDYFLWGYIKSLVYADKPQTLNHLKDNIRMLLPIYGHKGWKKSSKLDSRLDCIRRGGHMPQNYLSDK
ncbi:hypothetical protein EVAR_71286_1 [Eumeta japonica]|uniref:Uncharacterized protein n=1 Tax=Eumeta variegata TaxID=151549 RepID=A0A4C1T358_EUMVA|nr:hypothetical protein EVAR_71286_1 [Eumeta japonica]